MSNDMTYADYFNMKYAISSLIRKSFKLRNCMLDIDTRIRNVDTKSRRINRRVRRLKAKLDELSRNVDVLEEEINRLTAVREDGMAATYADVVIEPIDGVFNAIFFSSTYAFETMSEPKKLAKAMTQPISMYLQRHGVTTHTSMCKSANDVSFRVWANCEHYVAEAALMQLTFKDISTALGSAIDIKVFFSAIAQMFVEYHRNNCC